MMEFKRPREIYLDDNATTRVLPLAAQEVHDAMEQLYGNPSSSHITGLRARNILESARSIARKVLGASDGKIVFTSGATEAIQTGIFSTLCKIREGRLAATSGGERQDRKLLYGATEHKAVPQALEHWNRLLGIDNDILQIPSNEHGQLDLDFLREHISEAELVCTMAVNNETGVISDLAAIEEIVTSVPTNVPWLVDCVQAVAKIDLQLSGTAIDYAPISGHKLYAPKGIGILYVRESAPFTPLLAGGGQEGGARGGTENLPGVAALAAVLRCIDDQNTAVFQSSEVLRSFRDQIVTSLRKALPHIVFNTPFEKSVPTTINFSVEGITSKEILDLFDAAGIRVSSGSACGSAIQGSYVLEAMGLPKWRSDGAVRLSFGPATTAEDIRNASRRIEEAGQALCNSCLIVSHDASPRPGVTMNGLVQLKMGSMCSWMLSDAGSGHCVIIDPFEELALRLETIVECQGSKILAILDTHQHVDHDSPRAILLNVLGDHVENASQPTDLLGWPSALEQTVTIGDGSQATYFRFSDELIIAKTDLPGHTVDGQVFLVGTPTDQDRLPRENVRFAFTGDTLLIGGIGRTDFPTSSPESMLASLRKLAQIVDNHTILCPTHDYSNGFVTSLHCERQHNKFLARVLDPVSPVSVNAFIAEKSVIDSEITDETNCELVCGRIQTPSDLDSTSIDIRPEELQSFFAEHADSLIIDVREPHEFSFAQDWDALGLESPPENVPLTRLGNFLASLLAHQAVEPHRDIIFLCRSGSRSGKAAEVVRRMGFGRAFHIAGGIALGTDPSRPATQTDDVEYVI